MRSGQKDTYSVAFGEKRIAEIRGISKLTGLQQSAIIRFMWDNFKVAAVEKLLAGREQSLEGALAGIKKLMDELTEGPGEIAEPGVESEPVQEDKEEVVADVAENADSDDDDDPFEESPDDFDPATF